MARTKTQIATSMIATLRSVDPSIDVEVGPIRDFVITPTAKELAATEERAEHLALLYSLAFAQTASDAEVKALADNFGISRGRGSPSSGFLTFFSYTAPAAGSSYTVSRGTLVSTTDGTYMYRTMEVGSILGDAADAYYNGTKQYYEITIRAEAVAVGPDYDVPPYRVTKIVGSLTGISGAENRVAFTGGSVSETKAGHVSRIQTRFLGMERGTAGGILSNIRNYDTTNIKDVSIVYSTDHTLFRRKTTTPALDVYIIGEVGEQATVVFTAVGGEDTVTLLRQPILSIDSVTVNGLPASYEWVIDQLPETTKSTSARDFIRLTPPLTAADVVQVTYTYNKLLTNIQNDLFTYQGMFGTSILTRAAWEAPIALTVNISRLSVFSESRIQTQADGIITDYIEQELFIDALFPEVLRDRIQSRVAGVSTVTFSYFTRTDFGTLDVEVIELRKLERAVLDTANYNILVSS